MTRAEAMAADYAIYQRYGGRFSVAVWSARYGCDYTVAGWVPDSVKYRHPDARQRTTNTAPAVTP